MVTALAPLLAAWLGGQFSQENRAEVLIRSVVAEYSRLIISQENPDGTGTFIFRSMPHSDDDPWKLKLEAHEAELLALGPRASPLLLETLRNRKLESPARVRLAILLGRMRQSDALPPLTSLLDSSTEPWEREIYITAIGLSESRDALPMLRRYLERDDIPRRMVVWAMGMCGSEERRKEYLRVIEGLLQPKEFTNVYADLGMTWDPRSNPLLNRLGASDHMTRYAVETEENKTLPTDLWRLSYYGEPRVFRLLIDALRYPRDGVPLMARKLLEHKIKPLPDRVDLRRFELEFDPKHFDIWDIWWHHNWVKQPPTPMGTFAILVISSGPMIALVLCGPWLLCGSCRGVPFGATPCPYCRLTPGRSSLLLRLLRRRRAAARPA